MADLNIELTATKACEECSGTGGITRQPGPLSFDKEEILKQSGKGIVISPEEAQKMVDQLPKHVPGFTDRPSFVPCPRCGGTGQVKVKLTLEDLKNLLK